MWVQMNGAGPPVRLFTYAPGRGANHAHTLYAGIRPGSALMTDGYELYNGIAASLDLIHLGCWSHARRMFVKAEDAIPKVARGSHQPVTQFIAAFAQLYAVEARSKDWNAARRYRLRARCSTRVLARIEQMLLAQLHSVVPGSLFGKALNYLHNQWPKLVRYVENGAWPICNNVCENAIRPFVVGRNYPRFAIMEGSTRAAGRRPPGSRCRRDAFVQGCGAASWMRAAVNLP